VPNLAQIASGSPLAGWLGNETASFFALDPTGTTPIEPVADIVPGVTPFRVTVDVVDSETMARRYRVTRNALQDFGDASSNCYAELVAITIQGTLSAVGPLSPAVGAPLNPGARLDLIRMANLEQLADQRRPIMFVSPRISLAKAFIVSLDRLWTPANGESTGVSISLLEARIVGPLSLGIVPDVDSLEPGNNSTTGGGDGAVSPSSATPTQATTSQGAPGLQFSGTGGGFAG
jgi:hypothetical protein